MNVAVRYYTKSGNTRKLAAAIAEELGVRAEDVSRPLTEDADIVFLCNSVYWAGIDGEVKRFIKEPGAKIGKIVNVSTAALLESSYNQMKKLAAAEKIPLAGEEFHCRGSFRGLHRGRPDDHDLAQVRTFSKRVVSESV